MSLTKTPHASTKKFLSCADKKTGRSVSAIEQLSSAIGRGAMALVRQLKTAGFRPKSRYEYIVRRLTKCWKNSQNFLLRNVVKLVFLFGSLAYWVVANFINTLPAGLWIYHTWKLGKNQGYFSWLANSIAPQLIVLESYPNPQKTWQIFEIAVKKIFWVWFTVFFVSDIISKVGFWPFLVPYLDPTTRRKYFTQVFIGN